MENTQAEVLNDMKEMAPPITLTAAASAALREMMPISEGEDARHYLRVFVAGGGCAGIKYGLALDSVVDEGDTIFGGEVPIVIDPASLPRVRGSVVDHVATDMGGAFKVENPNARGGCGCGKSFSTDDWDDSEPRDGQASGCGGCPGGACGS